jgi:hypothetical protein
MIHITSLRITNGKLYKRKLHNKFTKDLPELKAFEDEQKEKFIKKKFPEGLPLQDPDSRTEFITVDSTHVTIPDREFLFYLVKELNFKSIPPKLIQLVKDL